MSLRLTKYGHSCVRLSDSDRALVIDPGVFSEAAEVLASADAVLITHEHPDHFDADAVREAVRKNRDLRVWAPTPVAQALADLGGRVSVARAGESFQAAGFGVETFGSQHALIHPSIPVVPNVGYLVDGAVFHPGDSFTVPTCAVQVLCLPIHAPWSKVGEVVDCMVAIRPPLAVQIHDGLLNQRGLDLVEGHVTRVGASYDSSFRHLAAGDSVEV